MINIVTPTTATAKSKLPVVLVSARVEFTPYDQNN